MNNRSIAYVIMASLVMTAGVKATPDLKKSVQVIEKKAGFLNAFDVMRNSKEGLEATKELEEKRKTLGDDLQKEYQAYAQLENDYKAKAAMLNDSARAQQEEKLVKMKRTLETKAKESEEEMQMAVQRTTDRVAKKVREAAAKIGQEMGLDSVTDMMTGQVLYVAPQVDLTAQATQKMDQEYKVQLASKKDATPAAKKSTTTA